MGDGAMLTETCPAGTSSRWPSITPVTGEHAAAFDFERELVHGMPELMRFARKLARNALEAEDLVQDCLERALRNRDRFEPGTNLHAWLFTILRNLHYTNYSRERRLCRTELSEDMRTEAPTQDWRIQLREVGEAMEKLTPEHGQVIQMVAIEGGSYQDAAAELQVSVGTIRSRLSRARTQLRSVQSRRAAVAAPERKAPSAAPAVAESDPHPAAKQPPAAISSASAVRFAPDAPAPYKHRFNPAVQPYPLAASTGPRLTPSFFACFKLSVERRSHAEATSLGHQTASHCSMIGTGLFPNGPVRSPPPERASVKWFAERPIRNVKSMVFRDPPQATCRGPPRCKLRSARPRFWRGVDWPIWSLGPGSG
jgi:RNA polymerase sigma-70 factor (ECF subfamily)